MIAKLFIKKKKIMQNIEVRLNNSPGQLALLGEVLGKNKISLEGGGVFSAGFYSIANFLVADGRAAKELLANAGLEVTSVQEVLILKLKQDVPGQLGAFCRRLADAGVNIQVQYSDHDHQLIIVPDFWEKGQAVASEWMKEA
jgi:hypothetical protein